MGPWVLIGYLGVYTRSNFKGQSKGPYPKPMYVDICVYIYTYTILRDSTAHLVRYIP